MALQKEITDNETGVSLPSAYIRVTRFAGNKENVRIIVGVYADSQARQNDKAPIHSSTHTIEYTEGMGDLLVAAYNHLKTLDAYAGATDV